MNWIQMPASSPLTGGEGQALRLISNFLLDEMGTSPISWAFISVGATPKLYVLRENKVCVVEHRAATRPGKG